MSVETAVYATRGGRDMSLDIYRPEGVPRAVVLMFHGGGWRAGSKAMMTAGAKELAKHGFVALACEYRLLGEAGWPAQIQDTRAAIRWARANAAHLGLKEPKVILEGFSAGGQMSLLAAGGAHYPEFDYPGDPVDHATSVDAVIAFYAPTEFRMAPNEIGVSTTARLLEGTATEEGGRRASPIAHVGSGYPPALLVHGADDMFVPYATSLRMFNALRQVGVAAELNLVSGHAHGFTGIPSAIVSMQARAVEFLDRTVFDPARYQAEALEFNRFARDDLEKKTAAGKSAAG